MRYGNSTLRLGVMEKGGRVRADDRILSLTAMTYIALSVRERNNA